MLETEKAKALVDSIFKGGDYAGDKTTFKLRTTIYDSNPGYYAEFEVRKPFKPTVTRRSQVADLIIEEDGTVKGLIDDYENRQFWPPVWTKMVNDVINHFSLTRVGNSGIEFIGYVDV
jgi:hypothetical protein